MFFSVAPQLITMFLSSLSSVPIVSHRLNVQCKYQYTFLLGTPKTHQSKYPCSIIGFCRYSRSLIIEMTKLVQRKDILIIEIPVIESFTKVFNLLFIQVRGPVDVCANFVYRWYLYRVTLFCFFKLTITLGKQ